MAFPNINKLGINFKIALAIGIAIVALVIYSLYHKHTHQHERQVKPDDNNSSKENRFDFGNDSEVLDHSGQVNNNTTTNTNGDGSSLGPASVFLGTAANFVLLSKGGITNVPNAITRVSGNLGVSPISSITGFSLVQVASNRYWTSALVTGKIYTPGNVAPTPIMLTTAVGDMETAYTDAAGRANPRATEFHEGNLGGLLLSPGLYKFSTNVNIATNLTLAGGTNDVFIFEISQNLLLANNKKIVLFGGVQAKNIFWQVAGQATLGTDSEFSGIILSKTAITLQTRAKFTGRLFAQTAIALDSNNIVSP
jgi:hypothetical protein